MILLRDYQKKAVERTISYFKKKNDPAVIVLPTGAGKSLIIAEICKTAIARVLVIAHVKELVEQNHSRYEALNLKAGIYSAGLGKKEFLEKVIFASIQSLVKTKEEFKNVRLVIIDECHRINNEDNSQYIHLITSLKKQNPRLCILGLTATPYRLGTGWIYNYGQNGEVKTRSTCFFKQCIFELSLEYMILNKYLVPPIKIDIPVTCYEFSELTQTGKIYSLNDLDRILKKQKRLTPLIIKNIQNIVHLYQRTAVMIFSGSRRHASEIASYFKKDEVEVILGDTPGEKRDKIIDDFKNKKFTYLVNVSVLTTGFDASHIDVIAILRPTESLSLYQQMIGRGLRLDRDKKDCLVLDYAGTECDIYAPQISEKKFIKESVEVSVRCPLCGHFNDFWGIVDSDGVIVEHFGRKCRGGTLNRETYHVTPCEYRFRFKICPVCLSENDITARECRECRTVLIDADSQLQKAKFSKEYHVLKPDSMQLSLEHTLLIIKYFDYDGEFLKEEYNLSNKIQFKKFNINFLRSHSKRPESLVHIESIQEVMEIRNNLRMPAFIIGRKLGKIWKITEKIFSESLRSFQ